MRRVSRLAAFRGAMQPHQTRQPKGVGRFLTWVMWSRQNALTTFMVAGFILLLGIGYVMVRLIYGYQLSQYEAQLAAQQQTQTTAPVLDADRYAPAQPRSDATSATASAPDEDEHPVSAGVLPPTPSATGTPQIGTGKPDLEAAPQAATREFLRVWLGASTYPSDRAWAAALAPYSSAELAGLFEMTDRSSVPRTQVAGLTSVTLGATSHVSVKLANSATVGVVLERGSDARWRVVDVAPEDA